MGEPPSHTDLADVLQDLTAPAGRNGVIAAVTGEGDIHAGRRRATEGARGAAPSGSEAEDPLHRHQGHGRQLWPGHRGPPERRCHRAGRSGPGSPEREAHHGRGTGPSLPAVRRLRAAEGAVPERPAAARLHRGGPGPGSAYTYTTAELLSLLSKAAAGATALEVSNSEAMSDEIMSSLLPLRKLQGLSPDHGPGPDLPPTPAAGLEAAEGHDLRECEQGVGTPYEQPDAISDGHHWQAGDT